MQGAERPHPPRPVRILFSAPARAEGADGLAVHKIGTPLYCRFRRRQLRFTMALGEPIANQKREYKLKAGIALTLAGLGLERPDHELYQDELKLIDMAEPLGLDSIW